MLNKIKELWGSLPKTGKVFVYVAFSYVLKEVAVELGTLDDGFFVNVLAGLINIALVFIQEAVPAVKAKLGK